MTSYMCFIQEVIYNLSVYLKIFELLLPLKVKLRSYKFKCNISMCNCQIASKRYSLNRRIPMLGEYGLL